MVVVVSVMKKKEKEIQIEFEFFIVNFSATIKFNRRQAQVQDRLY